MCYTCGGPVTLHKGCWSNCREKTEAYQTLFLELVKRVIINYQSMNIWRKENDYSTNNGSIESSSRIEAS
jgi:hypothetical protein